MEYADVISLAELKEKTRAVVQVNKRAVALFWANENAFALSNVCIHEGGPLIQGQVHEKDGQTVVQCPWHGFEFSLKTGKTFTPVPDSVDVYDAKIENKRVLVSVQPVSRGKRLSKMNPTAQALLEKCEAAHADRPKGPLRVLGISSTNLTPGLPRTSTSEKALEWALQLAREKYGADTRVLKLRELNIRPCEGFYSRDAAACTFPCSLTQMDETDEMHKVYENMIAWADVVLVASPIRWGNASSLLYKMIERLNAVQNQITLQKKYYIQNKVAGFIITGGQDNVQKIAGELMMFFTELGFALPKFSFVGWSRGWYQEDMPSNPQAMESSMDFKEDLEKLVNNCTVLAKLVMKNPEELPKMER
ncbi:MAG: NAD(P)H-dependent oxidoreductase [Candidatus Diapherotrites archaeon]|nr:NAD(P)H-dependent oxidoreductase [Candidatus Diapherotrites archaeon]